MLTAYMWAGSWPLCWPRASHHGTELQRPMSSHGLALQSPGHPGCRPVTEGPSWLEAPSDVEP